MLHSQSAAIFDLSEIDQDNIVVPLGIGGSSYNAFAHFPEIDSPDGLIYVWDVTNDSLKSISETTIIKLYSIEFRKEFISENMHTMKPSEMAKTLGLSERRVRQIIVEIRHEQNK